MGLFLFVSVGAAVAGGVVYFRLRRVQRAQFIREYAFPERITRKLQETYPHLQTEQILDAQNALRDYFQVCRIAGRRQVAMPSQAVDVLWHEFILFTRYYKDFCQRAFGRFLHHTPAEAMSSPEHAQGGIKRAWRLACRLENIKPQQPDRLPRLFALDEQLQINNGFRYQLNCAAALAAINAGTQQTGGVYCASHIGCSSCSSCSSSGHGCSSGCSSDGGDSGCGGGCGGD